MLVSVVIPTLDRPKLLLRAISSVLHQTHQELEIIVVADRPDSNTVSAVQSANDPRLRLILNPHPSTAAAARNVGADHAKGNGSPSSTMTTSGYRTSWNDSSLLGPPDLRRC